MSYTRPAAPLSHAPSTGDTNTGQWFLKAVSLANHIANSIIIACKTNAGALVFLIFVCALQVFTTAPAFTTIAAKTAHDFIKLVGGDMSMFGALIGIIAFFIMFMIEAYTFFSAMRGEHITSLFIATVLGTLSFMIKVDAYEFTSFWAFFTTVDFWVLLIISALPPFVIHNTSKDLYKRSLGATENGIMKDPNLARCEELVNDMTEEHLTR